MIPILQVRPSSPLTRILNSQPSPDDEGFITRSLSPQPWRMDLGAGQSAQDLACPGEEEPVTVEEQAGSSLLGPPPRPRIWGSHDYLPFPDEEAEVPRGYQSQSPCSELATRDRERNCRVAGPSATVSIRHGAGAGGAWPTSACLVCVSSLISGAGWAHPSRREPRRCVKQLTVRAQPAGGKGDPSPLCPWFGVIHAPAVN